MYHSGQRDLQDRFNSRALADRLDERVRHDRFTDADKRFIEALPFFFLATADAEGRPDCSYKGGDPGFVRVSAPDLLVFPDYDGNGMFRSLGNIAVNPSVGLLFLGLGDQGVRLRVNGQARLILEGEQLEGWPGAQALVEVIPGAIFPNCGRYIPGFRMEAPSADPPRAGQPAPEPEWKRHALFRDVVPPRHRP